MKHVHKHVQVFAIDQFDSLQTEALLQLLLYKVSDIKHLSTDKI